MPALSFDEILKAVDDRYLNFFADLLFLVRLDYYVSFKAAH